MVAVGLRAFLLAITLYRIESQNADGDEYCATFDSADCKREHQNAVTNDDMNGFCNRCANEAGASPLRKRCNLCCTACGVGSTPQDKIRELHKVAKKRDDVLFTWFHHADAMAQSCVSVDNDQGVVGAVGLNGGPPTYSGTQDLEKCAGKCISTYGCLRFSINAAGECRISSGKRLHHVHHEEISPKHENHNYDDKAEQCLIEHVPENRYSIVYEVDFYHPLPGSGQCREGPHGAWYVELPHVNTTAQCAHSCKNTECCKRFSAWPGATSCKISWGCEDNPGVPSSEEVSSHNHHYAGKCEIDYGAAGTIYELHPKAR